LEADFGDADFDNMSVIAVVKRAARRKESLPGEFQAAAFTSWYFLERPEC
jgi:hypothetical protein